MFEDFTNYAGCEPVGAALPRISIDERYYEKLGLKKDATNSEFLRKLTRESLIEKGIDKLPNKKKYYDQAKYEIEVFEETGLVDYILALWDIVQFAKENKIRMSRGRGSAASSLVLGLTDITKVDPIKYDLVFERFVSKTRIKKVGEENGVTYFDGSLLADVDLDFDYERRSEVIEYIKNKYEGRTAKILTFNTFSSKICIKEATKYFNGSSEEESALVSDLIQKKHGIVSTLAESIEDNEKFQDWAHDNEHVIKNARKVEGLNKNTGVHPSGIAISYQEIDSISPLQLTKDGDLVTGYEMGDVADLMVKFDILGLRTITIANKACEKAGIDIDDIDPEDPFIYQVLQNFNNPCGLFQISAETNFRVAQDIKPSNLEELGDVVAIARPGALGFLDDYIKQKYAPESMGLNKDLDEILSKSKNVLIFQETAMKIVSEVFGLPKEDAESLRKIIGKKQREKMPAWRDKIYEAAKKNGVDILVADYFWKAMEASANYSFAKAHAIPYAALAAQTVFLKYKYPKEFFCSILDTANFDPEPLRVIADVSKEVADFGIKILPPDLQKSSMDFLIEGSDIRYGLSSIKGISQNTLNALTEFAAINPKNKYEVFNTAKSVKINIGVLSSLIYAGCLGEFNRSKKVLEAQTFNILTDREKTNFILLGEKYDFDLLKSIIDVVENKTVGVDGKPIMKESRFATFKKKFEPYKQLFNENKKHEKLSIWWFEKQLLGYSFSMKLKDCFNEIYELNDLKEVEDERLDSWRAVAVVDDFFIKTSAKSGNRYMMLDISDDLGRRKVIFSDSKKEKKLTDSLIESRLKKGQIIVVSARRGRNGGTDFVDSIKITSEKVFMKTKDLK